MAHITAMLHTHNDALRLGRCLETLYACDEVVIVDHGSCDQTLRIAREYAAKVVSAQRAAHPNASPAEHVASSATDWIFCLDPRESLTEALAASLFEWKSDSLAPPPAAISFFLREETTAGWIAHPTPQTRLVPAAWSRWNGSLPASDSTAPTLQGEILRFTLP
jgi:cellulose synthase/poly-beta-1,6-N-acetylglucosamine synthase-like glycosyltransferase